MEGEPSSEGIGAFIHSLPCSQSLVHVVRARCHAGPTDDSEADPALRKHSPARKEKAWPFCKRDTDESQRGDRERREQRS